MFSESDRRIQFPPQPRRSNQKEPLIERTVSLGMLTSGNGIEVKEALNAQQELLQKLHQELDAEREASSTAANEALSMILRLQCERAALEMEISQYTRLSEEKMCHAETSLAAFEDMMYRKEMEIASLEFQVQAFRCKLLSLGCTDVSVAENKFPEDLLMLQTRDDEETTMRRLRSLASCQIDRIKNEGSPGSELETKEVIDESLDCKKSPEDSPSPQEDLEFYWDQIKKIDEHVQEISCSRDSCNLSPARGQIRTSDSPSSSNNVEELHGKSMMQEEERSENQDKDGRGHSRRQVERILSKPVREYPTELQGMKKRVEKLEGEIQKEQNRKLLLMLKEIHEQLSSIQSEITNLRPKSKNSQASSSTQDDDHSLHVIQEAMLHFWS